MVYFCLFFNFYWSIIALQCLDLLYCKVNIFSNIPSFVFPYHLGHHRTLSSVFCASRFSLVLYFIYNIDSVNVSIAASNSSDSFPPWERTTFSKLMQAQQTRLAKTEKQLKNCCKKKKSKLGLGDVCLLCSLLYK